MLIEKDAEAVWQHGKMKKNYGNLIDLFDRGERTKKVIIQTQFVANSSLSLLNPLDRKLLIKSNTFIEENASN